MPYGTIKIDTITFTDAGVDKSIAVSGLVQNPTFTGNVTVTGTVSGATVCATTVSGVTVSGTTANFASGVFTTQISGAIHVAPAGTAGAPSVQIGTGASIAPGLYSPATDQLGISTGGSFRLVVDSTGRVGIGTANPTELLQLSADTDPKIHFVDVGNTTAKIGIVGSTALGFEIAGSERLRIDSGGRLLVGTSSSRVNAFGQALQQIEGSSANTFFSVTVTDNNAFSGAFILAKSRGTAFQVLSNGDNVGILSFQGADGSALKEAARIDARVDGTPGANDMPGRLVFYTTADGASSPTERLRIDSSGQLTVAAKTNGLTNGVIFNVPYTGGQANAISQCLQAAGTGNVNTLARINMSTVDFASNNASYISFATSPGGSGAPSGDLTTERMRIESSGRLLVGTSSARSVGTQSWGIQQEGTTFTSTGISIVRNSADIYGSYFVFGKSRGTAVGGSTIVANGDELGRILFSGADGTDVDSLSAWISCEVDGTPGANDMPGRLVFSTTADGAVTPTEAMRINSGQELLIGYTAGNGAYRLQVNSQIFATSATIATSDGRYKENIATLNGCFDLIKALRPVSFTWKPQDSITRLDDEGNEVLVREGHNFPAGTQVGFIAQEVQEVLDEKPWLGSIVKQSARAAITDADGSELAPKEEFLGIAEGNLIAVLTSALQEAIAKIETLEAKVAALEEV